MTMPPTIVVHRDVDHLAISAAARLITRVSELQAQRDPGDTVSVALTGGGAGIAVARAVADSPDQSSIDWSRVDLWWGDERFLPPGDPERNETQAREALIDRVPVPPRRVHPMGADAGPFAGDPEAAATAYAGDLESTGVAARGLDIVLLGVGPDGHVASLFPDHPARDADGLAVAVHDAPKPPPTRVSLTMTTIRSAAEVWLVVAGNDKADAVAAALTAAPLPATQAHGTDTTLWLVDRAASSRLPPGSDRIDAP